MTLKDKQYILDAIKAFRDMAIERRAALKKLKAHSEVFPEHYVKLKLYGNFMKNEVNGWLLTLGNILDEINDYKLKPNNRKLTEKELLNDFLLNNCNEPSDIMLYRKSLLTANYPDIFEEFTNDDCEKIFNDYLKMSNELAKILSTKNTYTKQMLIEIIKKYI